MIALTGGAFLWTRAQARERRLDALERTRDSLRARLAALRAKDPVVASAPKGDVLIGVPEAVGSDLIRHATAAFLSRVEIELRDLRVRKTGRVQVQTLVGRMTPGHYELDVRIPSVRGILEPGVPQVHFRGSWIDVALPVRLARGEGHAELRFRWDSRGIAGAVCQDFQARLPVDGTVVPRTYTVAGRLEGSVSEGTLTAIPSFPDLVVNLRIDPSQESWRALDRTLDQRGFRCRTALKVVDVPGQIRRVLEKGFNVKVPLTIVKPLSFPAGLQQELTWEGRHARLYVMPRNIEVTPKLVWYSADVATEDRAPTPASTLPPAEQAPVLSLPPAAPPAAAPLVELPPPAATPTPTPAAEALPAAPTPDAAPAPAPTPEVPAAPSPAPTPPPV